MFHCLLAAMVSNEKHGVIQITAPLYVKCHCFPGTFKIFSLFLVFNSSITIWLEIVLSYPDWGSLSFLHLQMHVLHQSTKFSAIISSNIFLP